MRTTYEQDAQFINELLKDERRKTIEECARVAEDRRWGVHTPLEEIAAAIRALKDKP